MKDSSTQLVWDFFFVNDSQIDINGDGTFTVLPPDGFCAGPGETVDIMASITTNAIGRGRGVIEVTKDGVQVARSAQFDGNSGDPGNATVLLRETLADGEFSEYNINVKTVNNSGATDIVRVNTLQSSVRIYLQPEDVATTTALPDCPAS